MCVFCSRKPKARFKLTCLCSLRIISASRFEEARIVLFSAGFVLRLKTSNILMIYNKLSTIYQELHIVVDKLINFKV